MERLQRAMESRSRLESENRAKLEADQKRVEEERRRREADAEERRRQKEAEEAREREEKKQRQEKMLKMRKEQEEAQREVEEKQARVRRLLEEQDRAKAAGASSVGAKRKSGATPARIDSAEEKKRRLQSFMANNRANAALAASGGAPGATAVAAKLTNADPPARDASAAPHAVGEARAFGRAGGVFVPDLAVPRELGLGVGGGRRAAAQAHSRLGAVRPARALPVQAGQGGPG